MKAYSIPGFVGRSELDTLASWVSELPSHSLIVEIGSLWGRSSAAIAEAAPECTVCCIDTWAGHMCPGEDVLEIPEDIRRENCIPDPWSFPVSLEVFLENTKGFSNIQPLKVDGRPFKWAGRRVRAVWLDAAHTNPSDLDYIKAFLLFLHPGGWLGGHDIDNPAFPGVRLNADWVSNMLDSPVERGNGSMWRVKKPL